jgi:hypothetical protein
MRPHLHHRVVHAYYLSYRGKHIQEDCGQDSHKHKVRPYLKNNQSKRSREPEAKMAYISNGQVLDSQSQSPWKLSLIADFFWGIVKFAILIFKTLLEQDVKKGRGYRNSSDSRYDDGIGLPGNLPPRIGQINLHGPNPPPKAGG